MQECPQTSTQSVYQHGLSVRDHMFQLIEMLKSGKYDTSMWKIPDWFHKYRKDILQQLLPMEIIEEYTIHHDCGKPYCLTIDESGKKHFPNHADVSYQTWLQVGGNEAAAKLMKMDMIIHTMKAAEIDDFIKNPEAITLLIAGLAEIHSNASMFGGMKSQSFKIKWSHIQRRGKFICQKLFGE